MLSAGDGIARIYGLKKALAGELLELPNGVFGMVMNLETDTVGCVLFGEDRLIKEGDPVKRTGKVMEVPVGEALIGRVVNPLGQPIDGKGPIKTTKSRLVEVIAPGIVERSSRQRTAANRTQSHRFHDPHRPRPARTDHRRPPDRKIGRGGRCHHQPEGRAGRDPPHLYLCRDRAEAVQRRPGRAEAHRYGRDGIFDRGLRHGVRSRAAPISGALYRLRDGRRIHVERASMCSASTTIFPNTRKPIASFRSSFAARRAAKRIRATFSICIRGSWSAPASFRIKMAAAHLTALPIIETQAGDVSAYIPTNVISITDGQIYLESGLFYAGIRPAVNVGLSVSRVGGAAQIKAMRQVAGKLRLDLAQYNELAAFAQFGSDLDKSSQAQLARGQRMVELLKQDQYVPMPVEKQVVVLYAGANGFIDDVPVEAVRKFEAEILSFMERRHPETS